MKILHAKLTTLPVKNFGWADRSPVSRVVNHQMVAWNRWWSNRQAEDIFTAKAGATRRIEPGCL